MLVVLALIVLLAGVLAVAARLGFDARLDKIEETLRKPDLAVGPRFDLPPEVSDLASRLGARGDSAASFAVFEQTGQMWRTPGGKAMNFTARQTVRVDSPGFLWRARFSPLGVMLVADYLDGAIGGLDARLLGVIRVARIAGGGDIYRGEALRYLAELPWNPEAFLHNRLLDWTILDASTISVATGTGAERAEVTFELDSGGRVVAARAASRPYIAANGRMTFRPWHGRFWDYEMIGGRLLPRWGQVAWVLEDGDFVYWRGRLTSWRC